RCAGERGECFLRFQSRRPAAVFPRRLVDSPPASEMLFSERRALHACSNFRKRDVASRRHVVAEWRETAIIGRAQLLYGNVLCGFHYPLTDLFRSLDMRVNRGDDSRKNPLTRLHVFPDDLQHMGPVLLARKRDVEVSHPKFEQAWQQLSVVNVGTMR